MRHKHVSRTWATLVDGPFADAVSTAADYAGKSIAPETVATYKGDWADFCQWARRNGVGPTTLPVHPVVVAAWLVTLAPAIGRSALRRRVAAIAWHHRSTGHRWPAGHAVIWQTLSGIGRAHRRPVWPSAALTSAADRRLSRGPGRLARPGAVSHWPRRRARIVVDNPARLLDL